MRNRSQASLVDTGQPWLNPNYPSCAYRGQPFFISEFGGIWWNPKAAADEDSWGYGDRPKTIEAFYERFEGLCATLLDGNGEDVGGISFWHLERHNLATGEHKAVVSHVGVAPDLRGTGAAAVTVAGVLTAETDSPLTLHLAGGDLRGEGDGEGPVVQTGPAVEVFTGEWPS